ncbi:hypothetical protein MLD38_025392 [Melastoma candidum]|uniref:Uncharacterized protein n=1 Tax=Melastoma candidum TaxID=119954 RepID=A0ACB9NX00_9MYRT|nr:hypothetical protein MLD38_025392 [Melastoma candidum]
MKGLIRLRNNEGDMNRENEEEEEDNNDEDVNGSSESDVEEEKDSVLSRLDHETMICMVYPNYGFDHHNLLENRFDDQDMLIAQLEEDNMTLRERLFLMESEMEDLRRRLNFLERQNHVDVNSNEEVVENRLENESEVGSYVHPTSARNRIADGNGDADGRINNLTKSTINAMSGEEKPVVYKEKREDGVSRGVGAQGKDEKNEEMQKETTPREPDAEVDKHGSQEQ